MNTRGAIFVLASRTSGQQGPVAAWVSTAGWASAARRVLGQSWIVTPTGIVDPDRARRRASHPKLTAPPAFAWRRRVPTVAKTAAKDVREWDRARRFTVDPDGPWSGTDIAFVWQRHELFHTAGLDLARQLGLPSVVFVPAAVVWESKQWAVGRPGWASLLEHYGESNELRQADLVACGSDLVAEQVERLGVGSDHIIVTPSGVDLDLFAHDTDPAELRRELKLGDRFVVGWVGSFRRFHALEHAVEAVAQVEDAMLLLVGDGPERARVRELARDLGVPVRFTGTVPHHDIPRYLGAMDSALVLAAGGLPFYYSPLKLAEYLAAGLPVLAPDVAQVRDRLTDGDDAILVPPGDSAALAGQLKQLRDDPAMRARMGASARASAADKWAWDIQLRKILDLLSLSCH